ncbi:MAG: hypothetical protein R3321_13695 [Nitrososphaeraceae archaeon]|nr:hypothetical protein [Nitrososphaeraceae archaeon]
MRIKQNKNQIILSITDNDIKYWLFDIVDHKLEEQKITNNQVKSFFKKYKKGKLPGVKTFNDTELIIPNGYWVTASDARKIANVLSSF